MFSIYFVNFQYYSSETFNTVDDAIDYGKEKGFDFRVDYQADGKSMPVAAWSIIRGLRWF